MRQQKYILRYMRDSYRKCGGGGVVITAVFLTARLYSAFLGTWQIHWQSKWNINIPQPVLVAKETPAGIRTTRDLYNPSPSMCVCVLTANTMWVCVCVPLLARHVYTQKTVLKSRNNITILPCVHETCEGMSAVTSRVTASQSTLWYNRITASPFQLQVWTFPPQGDIPTLKAVLMHAEHFVLENMARMLHTPAY